MILAEVWAELDDSGELLAKRLGIDEEKDEKPGF
jgi:hypothetical protein